MKMKGTYCVRKNIDRSKNEKATDNRLFIETIYKDTFLFLFYNIKA